MTGATHADLLAHAQQLIREKDSIENNIRENEAVLQSQKVGMNDPLIDAEGFPRADVDIYAVRHARTQIILLTVPDPGLRNDLRAKMGEVEKALHAVHTQAQLEKQSAGAQPVQPPGMSDIQREAVNEWEYAYMNAIENVPFATINGVAPDSPANEAGLERGDKVVRFGTVDVSNHQNLRALSDLVAASENVSIQCRRTTTTLFSRRNTRATITEGHSRLGIAE
ncbi:26S proteasome non-ATPase regulatory subunit 9 [Rhizophlyctis rosea]|nr:26S proteasome non-ATPase regulatory subunit 9 [Rhizophlyctis rosea]